MKNIFVKSNNVHFALLFVSLVYGLNYIFLKKITPTLVSPQSLLIIRSSLSFFTMFLIAKIFGISTKIHEKKHWYRLLYCGVMGTSLNQFFFFLGMSKTSATNGSLIVTTIPIFVFIMSYIIYKDKITVLKIAGLILGISGAVGIILSSNKAGNIQAGNALGDFYILINCLFFGSYLVVIQPMMKIYNPIIIAMWLFFFGTIVNIPICYNYTFAVQ